MRIAQALIGATIAAATAPMLSPAAFALDVTLPAETARFKESNLPGYRLVQQDCLICHSAQYVLTQPSLPRSYWEGTVTKMKKIFGAPLPDEDIPAIVDYLAQTYGTEQETSATPGK